MYNARLFIRVAKPDFTDHFFVPMMCAVDSTP